MAAVPMNAVPMNAVPMHAVPMNAVPLALLHPLACTRVWLQCRAMASRTSWPR